MPTDAGGSKTAGDASLPDWSDFVSGLSRLPAADAEGPKQDRSRRRREEILRASLRVFARDGISRARLADIAAEAGIPLSSIYEYFPSKEDIAYAVPRVHLARFYEEYAAIAGPAVAAGERLRRYLRLACDFARRNPDWARTLYLEIWPSVLITDSPVRRSLDDYVRVILRLLRDGEARGEWGGGHNHYETAAILNGAVNQLIITWLLYRRPRDFMKGVDAMLARLLPALLQPVAPSKPSGTRARRRTGATPRA
jgi:AcrR family transcriptional regulator